MALMALLALPAVAFAQSPAVSPGVPAGADSVAVASATALGQMVRDNVDAWQEMGISVDPETFCRIFEVSYKGGNTGMTPEEANSFMSKLFSAKRAEATAAKAAAEQAWVEKMAAQPGAVVTPSGLVFSVITEGEGQSPTADDIVVVNYEGRLSDGTVFDGNLDGEPVEFPVGGLIPGFTEGLTMMKPGGTYRLAIPASLAYGAEGIPGVIPGGAALDFIVHLQGVAK